jgi:hypothetical protein
MAGFPQLLVSHTAFAFIRSLTASGKLFQSDKALPLQIHQQYYDF